MKNVDKTKFFRDVIDNYKAYGFSSQTSFIERFVNKRIIQKLKLKQNMGVSWKENEGWQIQLSTGGQFLVNDFECKPCNKLATDNVAKFIESELHDYMKNFFRLRYRVARKKYFALKENEMIK